MREIKITKNEASQRLDKFLRRYLPEAGGGFLYKQLRKKNIVLNGRKADGHEILAEGDVVRIWFSEETLEKFSGSSFSKPVQNIRKQKGGGSSAFSDALPVLYEDEQLLILNKPAGLLSQGDHSGDRSMVDWLLAYLLEKGERTEEDFRLFRPSVVNRLDRNTSGILLAAKTLPAAQELSRMLKERTVRKYYLALVAGTVTETVRAHGWLQKEPKTNKVRIFDHPVPEASEIETVYEPIAGAAIAPDHGLTVSDDAYHVKKLAGLDGTADAKERIAAAEKSGHTEKVQEEIKGRTVTLLRVELCTGRTHQIRAHLSFIGHPILGDVKYGDREWNRLASRRWKLNRQFLHAEEVAFPETVLLHGVSGRSFHAPLPEDLARVLAGLGIHKKVRS